MNWIDPNAITRNNRKIKEVIKNQEKLEIELDKLQERKNEIEWTRENRDEIIRCYQQLGNMIITFRNNKLRIQGLKRIILSSNITG